MPITLTDLQAAQTRIAPYLPPTLLEEARLDEPYYLKLENTNLTHSFKIRGAFNTIRSLSMAERVRGIVAASSGNHAQALAYAAHELGVPAVIYMPAHTPARKVEGVRRYGATADLSSANYDEAEAKALRRAQETGLAYISPYNDLRVIAGAGTVGLEIIAQLPDVEQVVVPVSGGGLISGVAAAVKLLKPSVQVLGVNALSAPSMYNVFYETTHEEDWNTLAEALSGAIEAGSVTVPIARQYVDRIVLVNETQIADAMRWMVDVQGWLVEGGGAVGVAAVLNGLLPLEGRPTVIVVSGGNVDGATLRQILA